MLDQRAADIVTARDEQRARAEHAEQAAAEARTETARLRTEIDQLRADGRQRDGKLIPPEQGGTRHRRSATGAPRTRCGRPAGRGDPPGGRAGRLPGAHTGRPGDGVVVHREPAPARRRPPRGIPAQGHRDRGTPVQGLAQRLSPVVPGRALLPRGKGALLSWPGGRTGKQPVNPCPGAARRRRRDLARGWRLPGLPARRGSAAHVLGRRDLPAVRRPRHAGMAVVARRRALSCGTGGRSGPADGGRRSAHA